MKHTDIRRIFRIMFLIGSLALGYLLVSAIRQESYWDIAFYLFIFIGYFMAYTYAIKNT